MLPTRIIHSNTLATELRIDVSPSEVLSEGLLSVFVMLESSITKAGVRAEKRKDFKRIAIINAPPYNISSLRGKVAALEFGSGRRGPASYRGDL